VEVGFNSSRAPVCVKETNNENYLYLVMPING
jgi:DNA polymerase III sliding clamp (beta) subunit (PCNA family)